MPECCISDSTELPAHLKGEQNQADLCPLVNFIASTRYARKALYFFINNFSDTIYYLLSSKLLNILKGYTCVFLETNISCFNLGDTGHVLSVCLFLKGFMDPVRPWPAAHRSGSQGWLQGGTGRSQVTGEAGAGGGLCSRVNNVRKDAVRPGMQRKEQTGEFLTYILLFFFSSSPTSAWLLFESILLPRFFEGHSVPPTMCPHQRMFAFLLLFSAWGVCDRLCAG